MSTSTQGTVQIGLWKNRLLLFHGARMRPSLFFAPRLHVLEQQQQRWRQLAIGRCSCVYS